MLCCLSPASVNYSEILASLRFAARAKSIKVKPTKNVDPATAKINALNAEVKAMRELMAKLEKLCGEAGLAGDVAKLPPIPVS